MAFTLTAYGALTVALRRPLRRQELLLDALADGLTSLHDSDYSMSIGEQRGRRPVATAGRRLQRAGHAPAGAAPGSLPARAAARHGDPGLAAGAAADQRERHDPVREPRGAAAARRRAQARGARARRAPRRAAAADARGARGRARPALHRAARRRSAGVPRLAPRVPAERPAASPAPAQAADARDERAGSGGLEEGDPRDRPRDQQLGGADRFPRPVGAAPRRAPGAGAAAPGVRRDRRADVAPVPVRGRLFPLRQAAAAAPDGRGLAPLPRLAAGGERVRGGGRRCPRARAGSTSRRSSRS